MNLGGLKEAPLLKIPEKDRIKRKSGTGWQEAPTTAVAGRPLQWRDSWGKTAGTVSTGAGCPGINRG